MVIEVVSLYIPPNTHAFSAWLGFIKLIEVVPV